MLRVRDDVRRWCSILALASLVAGIATTPLAVRGAAAPAGIRAAAQIDVANTPSRAPVPIRRNPFAGDAAEPPPERALRNAQTSGTAARANRATVSAIAVGARPSAVIVEDGASTIRGIGDRIGEHVVKNITLTGVFLDDGSVISIGPGHEAAPVPGDSFPAIPAGTATLPDVRGTN